MTPPLGHGTSRCSWNILSFPMSKSLRTYHRVPGYRRIFGPGTTIRREFFSVRSAYRMISAVKAQREDWLDHRPGHSNIAADRNFWSQLWKVWVPSKIRVFVWRLAHTSIPTGFVRHERNMADSQACSICGADEDTWRHSLLSCCMARRVWALGDEELLEHVISNQNTDAHLWLFWLMESTSQRDLTHVLVTMWAIRWACRKAIHENEFQSPLPIMSFIRRFLEDLDMLNSKRRDQCRRLLLREHVHGCRPRVKR